MLLVLVLFVIARYHRPRPLERARHSVGAPDVDALDLRTQRPIVLARTDRRDRPLDRVAPAAAVDAPVELIGGPPPGAATLEARDACAWFGDHLVLEGVDLVMPGGEVTALIGPSGCGKSTFLRLLNRMHELVPGAALDGEILLDGDDIYDAGMRAQQVRMRSRDGVPEAEPVPGHEHPRERAVGPQAGAHQVRRQGRARRGVAASAPACGARCATGSTSRAARCPVASSSGCASPVRSRCSPNVLLMDEPCSALDPTSTGRIEETIAELRGVVTS